MLNCSKCNKNCPISFENYKIFCPVCIRTHKMVKKPIKRKLTKRERFEITFFFFVALISLIGSVVWLIYSLVIDIKEGKGWKFPWTYFWGLIGLIIYVGFSLWFDRIRRLEKEKKGECCDSSKCDLKEKIIEE